MDAYIRKFVQSLASVKGRYSAGAFLAEGTRCVVDSLPHFGLRHLFCTAGWAEEHPAEAKNAEIVERRDIERMSQQKTPQPVLAVFDMPRERSYKFGGNFIIALDAVQDPGNLGTIIRVADWFAITDIIAGPGTADVFQPKVVQATMGALARVQVHRVSSLAQTLREAHAPVWGTFLDEAKDLFATPLNLRYGRLPIIVMGNEGNGISSEVESVISMRLRIPSFPYGKPSVADSLNVGVATGIIVGELQRRFQYECR